MATGLPLHVCAVIFPQAHAKFAGCSASRLGAVDFYLEFHRDRRADKNFLGLGSDFAKGRRARGVTSDHLANIKRQLRLAEGRDVALAQHLRNRRCNYN